MSPGSLLLKFRMTFGHGIKVAYWRDIVRKRILSTPPVTGNTDTTCEIHVLSSELDWLNLFWMLKSFYFNSGKQYALCIHDDGTMSDQACEAIAQHFPDSRFIRRQEADAHIVPLLEQYPRCKAFREMKENNLSLKIFDFSVYARSERIFIIDSDVLFFEAPQVIIERIEDPNYLKNSVNEDCKTAFSAPIEVLSEATGLTLQEGYNSGLGLIHKESMNWNWIEEFLSIPTITQGHHWRIEQTLYMLFSSKWGTELLPKEYQVYVEEGTKPGIPSRHYVGEVRHLMYSEGFKKLVEQGILKQ